jgi:hypothetical protein
MEQFLTYSRFYTIEDSGVMTALLDQMGIQYQLDHEVNQLDKIYIGETLDPMFVLKLPKNQFQKVTELLAKQARQDFEIPGFTHYFQSYEVSELEEIINNPNEWNGYDLEIAELLVKQKDKTSFNTKTPMKFSESYKPENVELKWITLGYILCFLTFFGIFFGLAITQAKKTLQNGETVNIYDKTTIGHGRNMIILGSILTVYVLLLKVLN